MKDCCKTGNEEPKKNKAWLKWVWFAIIGAAVTIVLMDQLNQ